MFDVIIALFSGLILGTITGIIPGLHVNAVNSFILISLTQIVSDFPLALTIFVVVLSITHSLVDIVPSIFLGAPNEESFLTILPGHEMLIKGEGFEAVILTILGAVSSIPIILIIVPLFIKIVPIIFEKIIFYIPFILIFISVYTFAREKKVFTGFIVFALAGILGYVSLNLPTSDSLLALLSGLFGGSGLILSSLNKTKILPQKIIRLKEIRITKKEYFSAIFGAGFSAPFFSFLPAIGSGHAATISTEIIPQTRKSFLITIGAINIIVNVLSFATLYAIGKTRTGAAATIKQILGELSGNHLIIIVIVAIIAIILASIVAIKVAKLFANNLLKLNYQLLSFSVFIFLVIFISIFSGWIGLIIFTTGSAIGIFAINSQVRRINMMACLLVPTILFYLF